MSDRPIPLLLCGYDPERAFARRLRSAASRIQRSPEVLQAFASGPEVSGGKVVRRGFSREYQIIRQELSEFGLRRCLTCGVLQAIEGFYWRKGVGWYSQCKTCHAKAVAKSKGKS